MANFCTNCGNKLIETSKFCSKCGANVNGTLHEKTSHSEHAAINHDSVELGQVTNISKGKKRGGCLKFFLIAMGIFTVLIILISCPDSTNDDMTDLDTIDSSDTSTVDNNDPVDAEDTTIKNDDVIDYGGFKGLLTVTDAKDDYKEDIGKDFSGTALFSLQQMSISISGMYLYIDEILMHDSENKKVAFTASWDDGQSLYEATGEYTFDGDTVTGSLKSYVNGDYTYSFEVSLQREEGY